MKPFIKKLRISNYKSIADMTVEDIGSFAVFAGANGSGKSNFFDALKFVSDFVRFGITEALKLHGGWENIKCVRLRNGKAGTFKFEVEVFQKFGSPFRNEERTYNSVNYKLNIKDFDKEPKIEEQIWYDEVLIYNRYPERKDKYENNINPNDIFFISLNKSDSIIEFYDVDQKRTLFNTISSEKSCFEYDIFLSVLFKNFNIYRIDPIIAKNETSSKIDSSSLNSDANNLALVFNRLEKNENIKETIIEFINLFVPNIVSITTKNEKFSDSKYLSFKEEGIKKEFPADMVSEGTIFALSILVAILDRDNSKGKWTLIEEPERGLHPKAIQEIINLIRIMAEEGLGLMPIWLTTHNTTLVRFLLPDELFFIDNKNGNTNIKKAIVELDSELPVDEAWLTNTLNGGLPW